MIRLLRNSCAVMAALLWLVSAASADLKIKTRTTVMGHATESTVYIKGPRERREMSFGGRGGMATLTQCDQKRMITITGNRCMIVSMGGAETSCPVMPTVGSLMKGTVSTEPVAPPRKGGVVTVTRTSTDTGERQEMFGYKARHIKTSMSMESSPDACNQSHMKMENDGWYADLSTAFSCGDDVHSLACGSPSARHGEPCSDRIVVKGNGGATLGYPLKQTTNMTSDQGTFTITTEVLEITNATEDAALFEMPAGCQVMDMSAMMGGKGNTPATSTATDAPEPSANVAKTAGAPSAAPAPVLAPKAEGVTRVGMVKLKDASGESLPTTNLQINLVSELGRHQFEVVPLDADTPHPAVEEEARAKQCDYILYTTVKQVKDPGSGGLPASVAPKGSTLDPAKFQALTEVTLYKIGKPLPEIKELNMAAAADQFAVDAVTSTFVAESDRVAQQVTEDAHPTTAAKPKSANKSATTHAKPK